MPTTLLQLLGKDLRSSPGNAVFFLRIHGGFEFARLALSYAADVIMRVQCAPRGRFKVTGRTAMTGWPLVGIILSGLLNAGLAEAIPSLRLSTGASSTTIIDDGQGDLNPALGAVTYAGSLGGFVVTVSTGISKPILGSATSPRLNLNSIDINGLKTGTLKLEFTDTDFTSPAPGPIAFTSSAGGFTTAGTVSYWSYLDTTNAAFGTQKPLTDGQYSAGSFTGSDAGSAVVGSGPYSLTEVIVVKLPALGVSSFQVDLQATPEPASLVLLGTGVLGVGLWSRRRKARASGGSSPSANSPVITPS